MLSYAIIKPPNVNSNIIQLFKNRITRIHFKKEANNLISINFFDKNNLKFSILVTLSVLKGGKKKKRKSRKKRKKRKTKKQKKRKKKGGNGKTRRRGKTTRNISQHSSSQLTTTRSNNSFDILGFVQKIFFRCYAALIFYYVINTFAPTYRPIQNQGTNIVPAVNWSSGVINPDLFPVLNPNINITFERLTQNQIKRLIVSKSGNITSLPLNQTGLADTLYAEIDLVSKANSPTDIALKEFNKLPFKERSSIILPNNEPSGYMTILKWNLNDGEYSITKIQHSRNLDRRCLEFTEQYNELLENIAKQHLDVMKQTNILKEHENSGAIQIYFNDLPTFSENHLFINDEQQGFHRDATQIVNPKLNLTTKLEQIKKTNYLRNQTSILRPDITSFPLSITYTPETEYTANVRVHPISGETKQINEDSQQTFVTIPGTSYTQVLAQDKGTEHGAVFLPQGRSLKNPRRILFVAVYPDKYYKLNDIVEDKQKE